MYSTIARLHNEAFVKSNRLEAGLNSDFFVDDYAFGLRTQGVAITRYTSGDTWFQPETPLVPNALTTLPSKISKRYSPQKREQNTGMPLPPEPQFMKQNSDKTERITSIREIIRKETSAPEVVVSKSTPIPGIDFARTSSDAAALLERLGKPVTYEAHQTYASTTPSAEQNRLVDNVQTSNQTTQQAKSVEVPTNERIVIDRKTYREAGRNISVGVDSQQDLLASESGAQIPKSQTNVTPGVKQNSQERIQTNVTPGVQSNVASERIVIARVPEKTFEHVSLSPIGHEIESLPNQVDSIRKAQSLEQQVQTSRQEQDPSSTTYITSGLRKKPNDSVSINHVIVDAAQIETPNVEVMNQSVESQTIVASREQQRKSQSPNLITITENRLVHAQDNSEIENMNDAPQVVRRVIEDFVQMKESQQQERTMQMQSVENKVMKIVKEELSQEVDSKVEATNEIKEIIREVIRAHPDAVQRSIGSDDMEYTLASRDAFLRVQIEQELRDKFESRLVENNKMMEKKNKLLFEEMLDRFLNP